jgi:hypothetical protein
VNLSKRGCCFLADKPLRGHPGATIEVYMKVKGIDLCVAGIIRHVRKGVRAGIEFVALSDRKCRQIDELIGELTETDRQVARRREQISKARRQRSESPEASAQQEQAVESSVHSKLLRFYGG